MSLWLTHPLFLPSLIVGVTIVLWATSLLAEFITALLFFAAAMMPSLTQAGLAVFPGATATGTLSWSMMGTGMRWAAAPRPTPWMWLPT